MTVEVVVEPEPGIQVLAQPGSAPDVSVEVNDQSLSIQVTQDTGTAVQVGAPPMVSIDVSAMGVAGAVGDQGPPGAGVSRNVTLKVYVNAGYAVALDPDDLARPASSLDPADADLVVGVALGAGAAGTTIEVVPVGEWLRPLDGPVGALFLGESGEMTPDPDTGTFSMQIATAVTARRVIIDLRDPVYV